MSPARHANMSSAADLADFPESRVLLANGVITYRECGQGPQTVLLLHGISSGAASWVECALMLGRRARVVAWNAPGYGESTPLTTPVPRGLDYAAQIDILLDTLGIASCVVVGHSLGALMAACFSQSFAQRVQSLLLFSPALGYGAPARQARAIEVRSTRLAALAEKGIAGVSTALPERLLTSAATAGQRQSVTANALRLNETGYRQAVEFLCADDIESYRVPVARTHVYCGEHDVVTTPEQSAAYARRHDLPFDLIAGAGHACYVEQPRRVAERILSHVRI